MKIAKSFFIIDFDSEKSSKDAYLKVCKWVAKHIISKDEIGETTWGIEKLKDTDLPTFRLELFAMLEEGTIKEDFCKICKEFHCAFYIKDTHDCSNCNMKAFNTRCKDKLHIQNTFRKEKIKLMLDKE